MLVYGDSRIKQQVSIFLEVTDSSLNLHGSTEPEYC